MRTHTTVIALALLSPLLSCSSGLGNNVVCSTSTVGSKSGNLTTGLFFGFPLRAPVTDHSAAGGLLPGSTSLTDRNVIFYAFATEAPADDAGAQGAGAYLDRDGVPDPNGMSDVFVAAVVDRQIDKRAFSYSLAGKFRHPRCTTCHSLAEADTTAFAQTPHPSLAPGDPGLQNVGESATNLCQSCHRFALDVFGTEAPPLNLAWRNPPVSLNSDFRKLSTGQLAQRTRSSPDNHFTQDRRVSWALASGVLTRIAPAFANNPFADGATGVVVGGADDDHDNVAEAFDTDGRRRLVPGGRTDFLTEIEAFRCGGPTDTRGAIADVALVSRRSTVAQSGSGASTQPDVTYVPDDAYAPGSEGSAGTLFVAFTSDANDLVAGVVGAFTQVYRARFDVRVRANGTVNLVYSATDLVSNAGAAGGNDNSFSPAINAAGDRIAFTSAATDIDTAGAAVDHVYLRDLTADSIERVSNGGTQDSAAPAIDDSGTVVAFESRHNFDGGSASGAPDIYYAEFGDPITNGALFQRRASEPGNSGGSDALGASRQPDVTRTSSGEILVAFASVNPLDSGVLGVPPADENIYIHRDAAGVQDTSIVSLGQNVIGDTELANGSSSEPRFIGNGDRLLIQTDATNLDSAFPLPPDPTFGATAFASGDENRASDVVMLKLVGYILQAGTNTIRAEAVSVSPAGAFGDNASLAPVGGTFALPASASPSKFLGFAGLRTVARNLGAADQASQVPGDATPWLSFIDDQVIAHGDFAPVWAIIRPACLGCHNDGAPGGGFSLGAGNPHTGFLRLTSGTSSNGACTDEPYIIPGDSSLGLVPSLITGTTDCNSRIMPPAGLLNGASIQVIETWIDNGATE